MPVIDIMPGVKVYQHQNYSILFGCPPEIIKHLMVMNLSFPDYIVLPDTIYQKGVLQNATEFPLYYFLFMEGNYFKGKKLSILGQKKYIENSKKLLSLTLLGPTLEEYEKLGHSPYYEQLYKEARALSVKDKDKKEIPIEGFVHFHSFKNNVLELEQFKLTHKDKNVYEVNDTIIDINFSEEQYPPYDLKPEYVSMMGSKFGINVLGGASGFTATNPSSGLLLNYNSDYMLIDCMPYLEYALSSRGISKQQVKSLFLSHIHDDHCNMFPLVLFNNKIKFLATKEIYWMACEKLALMTHHDINEFYSYFDFIELTPYESTEFYGISITPHYTVHSIPTIGATFKMQCNGHTKSIVFVGDNKSIVDIKKMVEEGSVSKSKYEILHKMYRDKYDLFFADGGMGILHGNPKDSMESLSSRVIFLHLDKLPKEFDTTFSLATHGKRFVIQEADERSFIIKTMIILDQHYPGITDEWKTTLLSNINIVKYNTGDVIMKQGELSNGNVYVIISGNASVLYHDGVELREVSTQETGDIIGDMAVIKRVEKRSASVVAKIPVTLCEIPGDLFYSFLKSEKRIDRIKEMWHNRSELEVNYPFNEFIDLVNQRIARKGFRMEIKKDEVILEQGEMGQELYIILKGSFSVIRDNKKIDEVKPGDMFGEYGIIAENIRNATVIANEDSVVLQLMKEDIKKIIDETPAFNFYVHHLMIERGQV